MINLNTKPLWEQRPPALQQAITNAFDRIEPCTHSSWSWYNGSEYYEMCGIDEQKLFKGIIQSNPSQKNFSVLDIGAGNFQWGVALAHFINAQSDLPEDIQVSIFSIRGESNTDAQKIKKGCCQLFHLGSFQCENLVQQFQTFKDKSYPFDLIISRWCIRHFADPLGGFLQAIHLLRSNTGIFLADGFFFLYESETLKDAENSDYKLIQLLLNAKVQFIVKDCDISRSFSHFAIKKPDHPIVLPISYSQAITGCNTETNRQVGSSCITQFKNESKLLPETKLNFISKNNIYGNFELFNEIKKIDAFIKKNLKCIHLQYNENLTQEDLHKAVNTGNKELALACLESNFDSMAKNSEGQTPLNLAIFHKNKELFDLLLDWWHSDSGQHFTDKTCLPLHMACSVDKEGYFVKKLIEFNKIQINDTDQNSKTPLDLAIQSENVKAVELLIQCKVKPSSTNRKSLENPLFFSVHETLGIGKCAAAEETSTHGLAEVINFISEGHCVVLAYSGSKEGLMYHKQNLKGENNNLIFIRINPNVNLLAEGEWPYYINKDTQCTDSLCNLNELKPDDFNETIFYSF